MAVTYEGMQPFVTPREMSISDIHQALEEFKLASRLAQTCGFDGVEIHGANGYLIDQFLRDGSNQRSDEYGGTALRRMTFLRNAIDAVAEVWPRHRIGVRLSPENAFNDMRDSDPAAHFLAFAAELSRLQLGYLHVLEGDMGSTTRTIDYRELRRRFSGTYIANNRYDKRRAEEALRSGDADFVAFGQLFLANPDLVDRYRGNVPLNDPDPATFYGGTERGYTDYPFASAQTIA